MSAVCHLSTPTGVFLRPTASRRSERPTNRAWNRAALFHSPIRSKVPQKQTFTLEICSMRPASDTTRCRASKDERNQWGISLEELKANKWRHPKWDELSAKQQAKLLGTSEILLQWKALYFPFALAVFLFFFRDSILRDMAQWVPFFSTAVKPLFLWLGDLIQQHVISRLPSLPFYPIMASIAEGLVRLSVFLLSFLYKWNNLLITVVSPWSLAIGSLTVNLAIAIASEAIKDSQKRALTLIGLPLGILSLLSAAGFVSLQTFAMIAGGICVANWIIRRPSPLAAITPLAISLLPVVQSSLFQTVLLLLLYSLAATRLCQYEVRKLDERTLEIGNRVIIAAPFGLIKSLALLWGFIVAQKTGRDLVLQWLLL